MVEAHLLRALTLERMGKYWDAALAFEKVSQIANSVAVWDHLGCCCARISRHVDAAAYFDEAIRMAPGRADLYMKYAHSASKSQTTYARSVEYASHAIELDGHLLEAYLIRAEVHALLGDAQRALDDLRRSIELSPSQVWVRMLAAERACIIASTDLEAREFMVQQIQIAVAMGLSKSVLLSSRPYKLHHDLFRGLPERASGSLGQDRKLSDSVVPTLAIQLMSVTFGE
jgi:tetratricopeptide (TPR) repeat protein